MAVATTNLYGAFDNPGDYWSVHCRIRDREAEVLRTTQGLRGPLWPGGGRCARLPILQFLVAYSPRSARFSLFAAQAGDLE